MQTCRFISSVNSTFMGSFLLSPDDDIEEEALCLFEAADLILRQRTRPHAGELVQLLGGFAYRHSGQQVLAVIVKHRFPFLPVLPIAQHFFENFRIRKRLSAKDSLSMPCSVILLWAAGSRPWLISALMRYGCILTLLRTFLLPPLQVQPQTAALY